MWLRACGLAAHRRGIAAPQEMKFGRQGAKRRPARRRAIAKVAGGRRPALEGLAAHRRGVAAPQEMKFGRQGAKRRPARRRAIAKVAGGRRPALEGQLSYPPLLAVKD